MRKDVERSQLKEEGRNDQSVRRKDNVNEWNVNYDLQRVNHCPDQAERRAEQQVDDKVEHDGKS